MNLISFHGAMSVVHLKHILCGEAIDLSGLPQKYQEANTNKFLKMVVTKIEGKLPLDIGLFPIDIRAAIVCHYIAYHNGFKDSDFKVNDKTNYSDYLDKQSDSEYPQYFRSLQLEAEDYPSPEVKGGFVKFHILNGYGAEALEMLCTTKAEWKRGLIALQLLHTTDFIEPNLAAYVNFAQERLEKIKMLEADILDEYMNIMTTAMSLYPMLLWPDVDDKGIVFLPFMAVRGHDDDEGGVDTKGARFCVCHIFAGRTWL